MLNKALQRIFLTQIEGFPQAVQIIGKSECVSGFNDHDYFDSRVFETRHRIAVTDDIVKPSQIHPIYLTTMEASSIEELYSKIEKIAEEFKEGANAFEIGNSTEITRYYPNDRERQIKTTIYPVQLVYIPESKYLKAAKKIVSMKKRGKKVGLVF